MSKPVLKKVLQLGIVVKDVEKAANTFCDLFGLSLKNVQFVDTSEYQAPIQYKGKTVRAGMKIAMLTAANIEFEFIQHVSGDVNSQKDYFNQCGAGIQHICILTDNYDNVVEEMQILGAEVLVDGGDGNIGYKYMDMRDSMGLVFEVYNDELLKTKNIKP